MIRSFLLLFFFLQAAGVEMVYAQQKNDGQWKTAQYVLSPTMPNELMKKVTTLKQEMDSAQVCQAIFDKYGMTGTILIFNPAKNQSFGFNAGRWDSAYLPASTFKIANLLIGFETGVIDTGTIFKWEGEKRHLPQWEKDLSLKEAFHVSCVPCFQEVARKIGPVRMKEYLAILDYGKMDVKPENIDLFWLEGKSAITPREQVAFIRRLYEENLPLSVPVIKTVKDILVIETTPEYRLSGKTGWATRNDNNYGWFVGYLETHGTAYFVATLIEPKDQEQISDFTMARKTVTMKVFKALGIIY